jgi:hypothetical protein
MEKKASTKQISYLKDILNSQNYKLSYFTTKTFDELTHNDITRLFSQLESPASTKQISYLKHILHSQNYKLSYFTTKPFNDLTRNDITRLFSQLETPVSVNITNFKYVIEQETLEYLIGKQYNTNTNEKIMDLISFKNLMILDYDIPKEITDNKITNKSQLLEKIEKTLKLYPYTFLIYETTNGYHVYCVSKTLPFSDYNTIKLMQSLDCDKYYIGFTRKLGFVTRLSKKAGRTEDFIERFIKQVNDYPILQELFDLVKFKDKLIN